MKKLSTRIIVIALAVILLLTGVVSAILLVNRGNNVSETTAPTGSSGSNSDNTPIQPVNTTYYIVHVGRPDTMSDADFAATVFPSDQVVTAGELIYVLPTPQRDGYIFSGWFYDSDLTMLASADDVVNKNMTLYPYLRPISEADAAIGDGSIHYVSKLDADTDFRVSVKAPSAEAVKNGILFESVTSNETLDFSVQDNKDGTYTIQPTGGLLEGKTYQITAIDREKGIEADGRVPSDDEYVLFVIFLCLCL